MGHSAGWRLLIAVLVLASMLGCSSTPDSSPARPSISEPSAKDGQEATIQAMAVVGVPYRFGGNTPDSVFDCGGLIRHAYRQSVGIKTPRTVKEIAQWGRAIPSGEARTGDLVIFGTGQTPSHAGIYVGNGRFVHAPSTGGTVRLEDMTKKYWSSRMIGFRRPAG